MRFLLAFITFFLTNIWLQGQIISYGQDDVDDDSIAIEQAPPKFIHKDYRNFNDYLEDALLRDHRSRMTTLSAVGANAFLEFTIGKDGKPSKISVECSNINLIFPLETALDSMPEWSPGIRNDVKVKTKMQYYINITRVEGGQYVVKEERMPPKLDKSTWPIKVGVMAACVAGLIWAWVRF